MFNRIIISCIGGFISVYCAVVALLTFFHLNFATHHLPGVLNAGFASIYGILSPIGLTGVLGGINRKRNLIKGFLFQYWISSMLMIGLSVADILLFNQYHKFALNKCKSSLSSKESKNSQAICNNRLQNNEKIAFIAAYVQGGVLLLMGAILLYCGYKELKDIKFDIETKNLIETSLKENASNSSPDNESINDNEDNNDNNDNNNKNNERFTSPGNYPVGRENKNVTFNRMAPPNHALHNNSSKNNKNNNKMYLQHSNSQTNLSRYAHPNPPQYIPQLPSPPLPIQQQPIHNNNNHHYHQPQQLKNRPSQKSLKSSQNDIPLKPLPNNQQYQQYQQYQHYQQLNNVKISRNGSNGSNGGRSDGYIRNNNNYDDHNYYYNNSKNNYNNNNNNYNNNNNNYNNNDDNDGYNGYDEIYNDY